MSKWISTKERLPQECGRYLFYLTEQTSLGKSGFCWNCSYNSYEERWYGEGLNGEEVATHWQPLPEPPK